MSKPTPGWLGRPVSRRVKVRRSTVLILLAFLVLGAVYFQIRTPPADRDAPEGGDAQQASIIITMPLPRACSVAPRLADGSRLTCSNLS